MNIVFCLYKYFRFGGLQRNCLMTARALVDRGHRVHVYTRDWDGEPPEWLTVTVLPVLAVMNVGKDNAFIKQVRKALAQEPYDCVVGFNRMPGLDVYYAADRCLADRYPERTIFYRISRRYRRRTAWERASFGRDSTTEIMLIRSSEREHFQRLYGTPDDRFHDLPPNLDSKSLLPERYPEAGKAIRGEFNIPEDHQLVLMVGSGFRAKGLDRAVEALAALPAASRETTTFLVVGRDRSARYEKQAAAHGIARRVIFTEGRDDVPRFYAAADILIHPARTENTGTVLLEALVMGLPIIATDVCGFADHIVQAQAGVVLPSPFRQEALNRALADLLGDAARRASLADKARTYGETADFYGRYEKAADIIEARARRNRDMPHDPHQQTV